MINPTTFRDDDFPAADGSPAVSGFWLDQDQNRQLRDALSAAATATQWIPEEQGRLRELLKLAQSNEEREAREYQIEYVEKYLTRAEEYANKRLEYFATIKSESDQKLEVEKCKTDGAHWFEYYAFGYDPRARTKLAIVPFGLFPRQKALIEWLDELVFFRRTSGIIEKSRDEGATETMVRWGARHWLFTSGFSMLLSTRKEDEVDAKKNKNTLFERVRYQIRLLPDWMLPVGFDVERDMLATMKLVNPANENTLLGEAPVPNMGRGGRVTCAMLDEFAFWSFSGYPQFRSLSQTTDSILMPSSVGGKLNQFADIAFDGYTPKFVLDWRDNPFKDRRWYNALPYGYISPKMSRTSIAQEVDRDYDASQPGKVWNVPEPYVFITRSEFLRPFEKAGLGAKFRDELGRFRIPKDWRVIETHDYGKSEGHEWAFLIGAQPRASYPLNDTHFIFLARNLEPTGLSTEEAVKQWREWEEALGIRKGKEYLNRPYMRYHSHEQKELRKVLRERYGEEWIAWNTDYQTGIETIEDWFSLSDKETKNPFRPELYGRAKIVCVAADDEYDLAFNSDTNSHFVTMSATEAGFLTARKQLGAYHYPQTELGKAKKDMRPEKEFDDIVDAFRGYAVNWNRTPEALSQAEEIDANMPESLRSYNLIPEGETAVPVGKQMARFEEEQRIRKQLDLEGEFDSDEFSSGGW